MGGAEGPFDAVAAKGEPSESPPLLGAGGATPDDDEVLPPGFFASGEDETDDEDALDDDMFALAAAEADPDASTPPVVETALPVAESASDPVAVAADASLFLFDEDAESDADDAEAAPEPDLTPGLFEDEPVFSNQVLAEEIAPPVAASPLSAPPAPVSTPPVSAFASPAPPAPSLVSAFAAPPAPVVEVADVNEQSDLSDDEAEDVAPVTLAAPVMRAATPDEELDALLGSAPPPEDDSGYAPHEAFGAPSPVQTPSFAGSIADAPPRPVSPSLVAAPLFDDDEIEDVAAVRVTLDQVIQAWPQFMSEAARISKRVSVMMGAAQPTDVRGKVVTITMGDRANFEMMSQPKQLDFIRKLLARSLSVESVGVKFVVAGNAPPPPVKIENANKKKRSDPLERLANLDREPLAPITSVSGGYDDSPSSYGAITGGRGNGDSGVYAPPARPALPASAFAPSAFAASAPVAAPAAAFAASVPPPPVSASGNGYQDSPASFAPPPVRETYAPAPRAYAAPPEAYGAPLNAVNGDPRMAEALAHPLVQEALEKFGGEVVFD